MPASTSTTPDVASTATMPASPVRSSTTPPNTGTDAPHTPLRPPAAVSGTRASAQTAHDGGDLVGRTSGGTTAAARAGTSPASAQCMASGHQSRLALGDLRARRRRRGQTRRRARRARRGHVDGDRGRPARRDAGRARSGARRLGHRCRRPRVRRGVGLPRRRTSASYAATWRAVSAASQPSSPAISSATAGRGRERRRAVEEVGPVRRGEHVVERRGHLVADGVDGLGPQVRQARRPAARRATGRRRRAPRPAGASVP